MCDASTAVAIGPGHFLVSNDEDNQLRLFGLNTPEPVKVLDITDFLVLENKKKEADIEGSAMMGGVLYWITSHGRNKDGELKRNRYQLFALTPEGMGGDISLKPSGKPYTHLMEDMLERPGFDKLQLASLKPETDPALAPEAPKGTNIEGLAAWKGTQLLIAFRNPVPEGKALLVPLENPSQVIKGEGEKARFGEPILLDLGGLGIRSIEFWEQRNTYVIVAGAVDDCPAFQVFLWNPAKPPVRLSGADLFGLRPEAIVVYPDRPNEILLLSDDGGIKVGNVECKDLKPSGQRAFRAKWLSVPPKL
jgi:Protein of unknown function (DUF3616)